MCSFNVIFQMLSVWRFASTFVTFLYSFMCWKRLRLPGQKSLPHAVSYFCHVQKQIETNHRQTVKSLTDGAKKSRKNRDLNSCVTISSFRSWNSFEYKSFMWSFCSENDLLLYYVHIYVVHIWNIYSLLTKHIIFLCSIQKSVKPPL